MTTVKRTSRKFSDFLKLANIFLQTVGVMPYADSQAIARKPLLIKIAFYVSIGNLIFFLINDIIYAMREFQSGNGFIEGVIAMTYIGFILISATKMLCLWWQRQVLTSIMHELQLLFPKTLTQQFDYKLEKYYRQNKYMTTSFTVLYMIISFYKVFDYIIIASIFGAASGNDSGSCGISSCKRNVPYVEVVLWNYDDNWSYYFVYAAQLLGGYTAASQQIASDLLLFGLATQLIMHYDYMSSSIREHCVQHSVVELHKEDLQKDLEFLQSIVIYHENLLRLSEELNTIFGLQLLTNFMVSCCIMCFLSFTLNIGVGRDLKIRFLFYLICTFVQVVYICLVGQQLYDASTNIRNAAYDQNWLTADPKYKKILFMIGQRAGKPFVLKGTHFIHITRGTLTLIMHITYKLFTLLRAIYSE